MTARYDRALDLVKELVPACDVSHIYGNALAAPLWISQKRKDQHWYGPETDLWQKDDIVGLTGIHSVARGALNRQSHLTTGFGQTQGSGQVGVGRGCQANVSAAGKGWLCA